MAAKIIPSPDWFVGVDSLALCTEGSWLDSITIEVSQILEGFLVRESSTRKTTI